MMERLGVRYFQPDLGALLPLKSPSRHLALGQCDNTAVRIKVKRECMYEDVNYRRRMQIRGIGLPRPTSIFTGVGGLIRVVNLTNTCRH